MIKRLLFLSLFFIVNLCYAQIPSKSDNSLDPYLNNHNEWFQTKEANRIAENILLWQRITGGWPKNEDMTVTVDPVLEKTLKEDHSRVDDSTIDNKATVIQLRFLANYLVSNKQYDKKFLHSFLRGLDYLFEAQYPHGGWPQFYPFHYKPFFREITFNDNAMTNVMELLLSLQDERYSSIVGEYSQKINISFNKGLDLILKLQIVQNGVLTGWCQQYDFKTLKPTDARIYEVPSIASLETAGILKFLMKIKNPSPEIKKSIEGGVKWLQQSRIDGYKLVVQRDEADLVIDRYIVASPTSEKLWARFYEISSNRPIFIGRDGIVKHSIQEIERERRAGYEFYIHGLESTYEKEYPLWKKNNP